MGRNYPSYQHGNHCHNYNLMCAVVYNESKRKQKQPKLNAEDRTNNNIECRQHTN